jgi:tRNA-Thr(GGU) m(6)t(6)A37 methyltransferase TsaA
MNCQVQRTSKALYTWIGAGISGEIMEITFHPIGTIHSPFTDLTDMPIQPTGAASAPGTVEILPEFAEGLKDLGGFSHLILIYHLHQARRVSLSVIPFLDSEPRGIFATRAPTRPNPIGLSVVRLLKIEGNILFLEALDILDGTPLLDIKPYVPAFDGHPEARAGWLERAQASVRKTKSDGRFES